MSVSFQERLGELIKKKNVSCREVARGIEVSNSLLSKYLNGLHKPKMDILKRMAEYFDVSVEYLTGSDDTYSELHNVVMYAYDKGLKANDIKEAIEFAAKVKGKE